MVATVENKEHLDSAAQEKEEDSCPPSPDPNFEIPTFCNDYEKKIPNVKKEEFKAILETKQRNAEEAYAVEEQKAEDAKAEAESKYSLAEAKYESAIRVLDMKTENAQKALKTAYNKCLRDSSPKDCSSEDEIPQHKKAICVATLIRDLWAKDIEIKAEKQKLELTKSEAEANWAKAEKAYDLAISRAKADKCKAYKDADLEWRENLGKALEEIC